jgi:hypothetical protein
MTPEQKSELTRHHGRINEDGDPTNKGSIPWLIREMLENVDRITDLIGPKHDRVKKKDLRIILQDLRDQIKEMRRRLD